VLGSRRCWKQRIDKVPDCSQRGQNENPRNGTYPYSKKSLIQFHSSPISLFCCVILPIEETYGRACETFARAGIA